MAEVHLFFWKDDDQVSRAHHSELLSGQLLERQGIFLDPFNAILEEIDISLGDLDLALELVSVGARSREVTVALETRGSEEGQ